MHCFFMLMCEKFIVLCIITIDKRGYSAYNLKHLLQN